MAVHRLTKVIQNLRRSTLPDEASVSDGQLLDQFIEHHDEFAFAALVRRHGAMVWGVCRRIVAHHQDAEDAFQATFLVLARKATAIRPRALVANWLHGVAHRTALKARTITGKRHSREKQVIDMPEPKAVQHDSRRDLEPLIDQELAALPDKYRIAVVLCDLEGKTGKAVARQLKIPEGTLSSRLRTARMMLAKRLARHGVTLSGGALATALSQNAVSAGAPSVLVSSTIKAATLTAAGPTAAAGLISAHVAALTQGVIKTMLLTKLKTVLYALLVLGVAALGGGLLSQHAAEGQQVQAEGAGKKPSTAKTESPPKSIDELLLHGEWICRDDKNFPAIFIFGPGKTVQVTQDGSGYETGTYAVNWNKKPHEIDLRLSPKEPRMRAIMEFLEPGKFRIEIGDDIDRPKAFTKEALVFVRLEKPKAGSPQEKEQAESDFRMAEFYRRAGKPWTANFYYELVERRYPDTDLAEKAKQGIMDMEKYRIRRNGAFDGWNSPEQAEKPVPPKPAPAPVIRGEVLKVKLAELAVSLVVESDKQIVFLTSSDETKGDATYRISDKTIVLNAGSKERMKFGQIKAGDRITIELDAAKAFVTQIVVLRDRAAGPGVADIKAVNQHAFKIPIEIGPSRLGQIESIDLYVSSDEGATWSLNQRMGSPIDTKDAFSVTVPKDGIYWFAVHMNMRNGIAPPKEKELAASCVKVCVDTAQSQK